ncbi:O-antigen ligase family protein [Candidatus Viridilinea mediisalina]|uniref:O-antigen ligase family protein n=1 Tax=Candidatus Viridilinea mediisalina TaxID=2024553 RepID=UPI000F5A223C|nr:O-antigen ligase family protein [Candidatus Viridilinea mediisalina]
MNSASYPIHNKQFTTLSLFFLSSLFISLGVSIAIFASQTHLGILLTAIGVAIPIWTALVSYSSYRITLFGLLICCIVLVPPLSLGNLNWRVHQIFLLFLLPFIVYWRRHTLSRLDVLLSLYALAIITSTIVGSILGNTPALRDWFELAKPGFWWLIFSFGLGCGWSWKSKIHALWIFLICGFGLTILSIAQYTNAGDVNNWLTPIFVTNEDFLRVANYRVLGTFGNPVRVGSTMAGILGVLGVFILFGKCSLWLRMFLVLYALGVSIAILMTASRVSLGAGGLAVIGAVLFFIWYRIRFVFSKLIVTILLSLLAMFGLIGVFLWAERISRDYSYASAILSGNPLIGTLYRLNSVGSEFDEGARRLSDWQLAWQLGLESPVFGVGPSKNVDDFTYFHSEHLTVFRRYGFVGVFLFTMIYVNIILYAYKEFRSGIELRNQSKIILSLSVLLFTVVFVLDGFFSNGAASDFQQSAVHWWLVGVLYGRQRREVT